MSSYYMRNRPALAESKKDVRAPRTNFGVSEKGYVAGAGRGAIGFTTRSDIGPAKQAVLPVDRSISAQKERARQLLMRKQPGGAGPLPSAMTAMSRDSEDLSESNYDSFSGYKATTASTEVYDSEDREADRIFAAVEQHIDGRRKRRREELEKSQWEEYKRKRPHVQEMFKDEKRELKKLSLEDWESIPEASDLTRKKQSSSRSRAEKFTPVPDSIVEGASAQSAVSGTATTFGGMGSGMQTTVSGVGTAVSSGKPTAAGYCTDLTYLGTARKMQLGHTIDSMSDSVSGQTVVDPKGYLTSLSSFDILTSDHGTDVSDIKKARKLLESVIKSDPRHAPGWIAAARLEKSAGKTQRARAIIRQASEVCHKSVDVWLEAAQIHDLKESKALLAKAVKCIPKSVKLWMKACEKESDVKLKKLVLKKALEIVPNSFLLWKTAVEFENANDARILLSRAVECIPDNVQLWLALARLESYANAKKVLNRAGKKCPFEPSIYIAAAKLEEREGGKGPSAVRAIVAKALKVLEANRIVVDRELWMKEAAKCSQNGYPLSCHAIIEAVIEKGIEEEDMRQHFLKDICHWKQAESKSKTATDSRNGNVEMCRGIYNFVLAKFKGASFEWKLWWDLACFERDFTGDLEACQSALRTACFERSSDSVKLWLLYVKLLWTSLADMDAARKVLKAAFVSNPKSERLYLAASKIEIECKCYGKARQLLAKARAEIPDSPVLYMKSALLERLISAHGLFEAKPKNEEESAALDSATTAGSGLTVKQSAMAATVPTEADLINAAIAKFGMREPRLWLMKIQLAERLGDLKTVRETCTSALRSAGSDRRMVALWIEYARIEEETSKNLPKARSILERGRVLHPAADILYYCAVELELRHGNEAIAKHILAKGLQECNRGAAKSGLLLALTIRIEAFAVRKGKCVEAIKELKNDAYVLCEVARYTWQCHKLKHAREWFERALKANADIGDCWAQYLRFLRAIGAAVDEQKQVIRRCADAEPRHGILWTKVSKKIGNEHMTVPQILVTVAKTLVSDV